MKYLGYREESRSAWGETVEVDDNDDDPELDDEQMRTGALLRIADALERAYPPPPTGSLRGPWESKVRAYEAFLAARGLDGADDYVNWRLPDNLEAALSNLPFDAESAAELCALDGWHVQSVCRLTDDMMKKLRAAMKARSLYFDDEWPD